MSESQQRIAIIGGGLAGLSCAQELRAMGIEPTVFDRGRLPGGRLSSRAVSLDHTLRVVYDHGAPMIHVLDQAFTIKAQEWVEQGVAAWWTPTRSLADGSTARDGRVLVGVPTMNSIIDALCEKLDLCPSTTVNGLTRTGDRWRLDLEQYGQTQRASRMFDQVVLAMPPEQAWRLVGTLDIPRFASLESVRSVPTWVCMMCLDLGDQLAKLPDLLDSQDGDRIVFSHAKPERALPDGITTLVYYANRDWSQTHCESCEEDLSAAIRDRVLHLLECRLRFKVSWVQILDQRMHRWGLSRAETSFDQAFFFDPSLAIGCCGDWFAGNDAQAAYLSGRSLARALRL